MPVTGNIVSVTPGAWPGGQRDVREPSIAAMLGAVFDHAWEIAEGPPAVGVRGGAAPSPGVIT